MEIKKKAEDVFKYYETYTDLNPVLIHSNVPNKNTVLENIKNMNKEIQILTPNRIGESGTYAINEIFKNALIFWRINELFFLFCFFIEEI